MSKDLNRRVDDALNNMRAPFGPKEASWERLVLRLDVEEPKRRKNFLPAMIGIAASIALVLGVWSMLSEDVMLHQTAATEHKTITLPDGSTVQLNAGTELSYNADDFLSDRRLTLDGEAFFQVQKGSQFKVITDQGDVTVLGTSFNVFDRPGFFEVQCSTGMVSVSHADETVILTPGLATNNSTGSLSPVYAEETSTWMKGNYRFEEVPVRIVLDEIERQYGVNVTNPGLDGMLFSGAFDSTDLESALMIICQPMGMEYSINQGTDVTITLK